MEFSMSLWAKAPQWLWKAKMEDLTSDPLWPAHLCTFFIRYHLMIVSLDTIKLNRYGLKLFMLPYFDDFFLGKFSNTYVLDWASETEILNDGPNWRGSRLRELNRYFPIFKMLFWFWIFAKKWKDVKVSSNVKN